MTVVEFTKGAVVPVQCRDEIGWLSHFPMIRNQHK